MTTADDAPSKARNRFGQGLLAAAFAFLIGAIVFALLSENKSPADPDDNRQVARGRSVYAQSSWPPEARRAQLDVTLEQRRR